MHANRPAQDHHVARLGPGPGDVNSRRHNTHPGRIDEDPVSTAVINDLGVAGDNRHIRFLCCAGHGSNNLLQLGQRQPFLQDESCGQIERLRPNHRQIVDRAAHSQFANVPARKEDRLHHIAISGHGQARASSPQGVTVGG